MPDIVLATLNAKYIHGSFGLRYLMTNLGEVQDRACMAEFVINQQRLEMVESILALVFQRLALWSAATHASDRAPCRRPFPL